MGIKQQLNALQTGGTRVVSLGLFLNTEYVTLLQEKLRDQGKRLLADFNLFSLPTQKNYNIFSVFLVKRYSGFLLFSVLVLGIILGKNMVIIYTFSPIIYCLINLRVLYIFSAFPLNFLIHISSCFYLIARAVSLSA